MRYNKDIFRLDELDTGLKLVRYSVNTDYNSKEWLLNGWLKRKSIINIISHYVKIKIVVRAILE